MIEMAKYYRGWSLVTQKHCCNCLSRNSHAIYYKNDGMSSGYGKVELVVEQPTKKGSRIVLYAQSFPCASIVDAIDRSINIHLGNPPPYIISSRWK